MTIEIDTTPETAATTITEYNPVAAGLAELRGRYLDVTYEVATTKGMTAAVAARAEIRELRMYLEKRRKKIKAPALKRCQEIDSQAKLLTAELVKLEDPIDEQIKAEQAKKRAVKEAAEQAERDRVAQVERDRLAAEQVELDRQRAELAAAKEEQERRIAAARAKAEAEIAERARVAREAREKADAAAAAERKRLAAIEAERQAQERAAIAKHEAEVRAEAERQAAARAEVEAAERKAAEERAEKERAAQAKREAAEVEHATLLDAASEVVACFDGWGVAEELPARKLAAAVERADEGAEAAE